jgi:2-polyprenyl-3-methyl-5-hydroxy-6-metoxy-1,4-benzoquinol methylase
MNENQAVIKQAFDRPQWYLTKAAYNIRIRAETIQSFTRGTESENILDIGCGDGSLSLPLLNERNRLTLVDRSTTMLDIARSRVPSAASNRVRILNEDFMSVELPQQAFDLVICVGVLAYIEDARPFMGKVTSLLKPGGGLVLECTDGSHFITHIIQGYKWGRTLLGGTKFPTIRRPSSEVLKVATELGLEAAGSFRYSLPLPGFRRLLSQGASYRSIRTLYGTPSSNRASVLGNECLFYLRRAVSPASPRLATNMRETTVV